MTQSVNIEYVKKEFENYIQTEIIDKNKLRDIGIRNKNKKSGI